MATKTRTGHQDSGTADSQIDSMADRIARSFTVGTDEDGYDHHYYRPADAVVVFDGRELDHVEHLDGRLLKEWIAFVDGRRGWLTPGPHAQLGVARDHERKTGGEN